jgi:DNA polymerase-3 subunit gamma/tau
MPRSTRAPTPAAEPVADLQPNGHRVLYRRWRAQRFGELIGQDAIVTTLRHAVASNRVGHAYLFVGPRGTGKTSTARILAKAINCLDRGEDGEPCDRCAACVAIREGRALDVIEIDAASHGLVEDARDLVMRALTAPAELRRRVYIVDEVHMLSTHAFNALLKLVEEPPDHVVFVLATTDTHKVPPTIISRTQRFDFRPLPDELVAGKLTRICAAEGAEADAAALSLIARLADGGMRDAESLLDQVLAYAGKRVTAQAVRDTIGLADEADVAALVDDYLADDVGAALDRIAALADAGRDLGQVAAQLEGLVRERLLASARDPRQARRLAHLLRNVAEAAGVGAREGRARLLLELLAVESAPVGAPPAAAPQPGQSRSGEKRSAQHAPVTTPVPAPRAATVSPRVETPPAAEAAGVEPPTAPADATTPALDELRGRWAEVVARATPVIKPLLAECRPIALSGVRLTLAFPEGREFMRARITQRASAIEELLLTVVGARLAIECVATNVELEPLSLEQALTGDGDPHARGILEDVLRITGGELIDVPEVR